MLTKKSQHLGKVSDTKYVFSLIFARTFSEVKEKKTTQLYKETFYPKYNHAIAVQYGLKILSKADSVSAFNLFFAM